MNSKRIVVCAPQSPFVRGGAELLTAKLLEKLRDRGHEADLLTIPWAHTPKREILMNALAWRTIKIQDILGRDVDVVITTKFPAYYVKHPNKILWLFHQFRGAYELFDTDYTSFRNDPESRMYRDLIQRMDTALIPEHRKIFVLSENVGKRLRSYNGLTGEVLYGPSLRENLRHESYGDYILYVGRFSANKRIALMLETAALCRDRRFVFAGGGEQLEWARAFAQESRLSNVEIRGSCSDGEIVDLYANAFAVFYIPIDEDYGLVPLESFLSSKPVITTTDSGGILELVQHEKTGLVSQPTSSSLAAAVQNLYNDAVRSQRMGEAGFRRAAKLSWDKFFSRLEEYF